MDLFALHSVNFAFNGMEIFHNLDLSLAPGRFYGILGPNGCGKTTLLDLLCGLRQPAGGTIRLKDKILADWSRRELARVIALVPQDFMVRFSFTVREVVEMGRHAHISRFSSLGEKDLDIVEHVMTELDIDGLANRLVTAISGGEKQRVAVARALAQEPQVLLLDEATSNLDVFHSLSILQVIRSRINNHVGVVAVFHDVNQAAMFCDEIVFLKQGKIVYGLRSLIEMDDFNGCPQVRFKPPKLFTGAAAARDQGNQHRWAIADCPDRAQQQRL